MPADPEKTVLYGALIFTGSIAAVALGYACKQAYDNILPYQVCCLRKLLLGSGRERASSL